MTPTPNGRTAHKWRERLASIVTDDDFDAIICRMVADAVGGDKDARNQLPDRLCGKAGPVRDEEMDSDEHKVIYIQRVMAMGENLPPGSIPTLPGEHSQCRRHRDTMRLCAAATPFADPG